MEQTVAAPEEHLRPRLVTIDRAAGLLGIGRTTVYKLIGEGELPVVHVRRAARIPVEAIDAYVKRLTAAKHAVLRSVPSHRAPGA